ncbi:hypothetical protein ACR9GK_19990, partial [Enterobacter hormaechei subsp. steigerwaltii]
GSAEPGGCAAAALAEWGSTTGQQRWPGAEGGQTGVDFYCRKFADRVSEPVATPRHATPRHATPRHATPRHATPRHATPRHATPRHATQDRIRDNLPSQWLLSTSTGLTSGREGAAPQALALPPVSPKG